MQRKKEISLLNCLFCIMVVFIHLLSEPVVALTSGTWQHGIVYIIQQLAFVAVYGFIFLSGVKLFMRKTPQSIGQFYKRRFTAVYLPYLVAVTIYYIIFHFSYGYEFSLKNIWLFYGLGRVASHTYFVVALIQLYLLMPLWRWLLNRYNWSILAFGSILITLLYIPILQFFITRHAPNHELKYLDRFFVTYLMFWITGCIAGKYYDKFTGLLRRSFGLIITAAVVCGAFFAYFSLPQGSGLDWYIYSILRNSYMLLGTLALFAISVKLGDVKIADTRFFKWLDGSSYHIYLYHMLCVIGANVITDRLGITGTIKRFPVRVIITFGATFIICFVIGRLKKALTKRQMA